MLDRPGHRWRKLTHRFPFIHRLIWLVSVCTQLVGAYLAGLALLDLSDVESRASHVLEVLRWPAVGLLCMMLAVGLLGAFRDARGHGAPIRARILRDLLILFVLATAAQVLLSQNYKPILFKLCFAVAAGIFACLRLLDSRRESWQRHGWWRISEFVLSCACASVLFLEIGLRLASQVMTTPLLSRDTTSVPEVVERFRNVPGALHFGFPCNKTSHYDEEFEAGELGTVVSIGDSFSFSLVPHYYHYTTVCERKLDGVAVHNLGYAGLGPGGYLYMLETEGMQLNPDVVLVNLFAGNDVFDVLRWNAPSSILASITDRRNVLSYLLPRRLIRLAWEGEGLAQIGHAPEGMLGEGETVRGPEAIGQAYPWVLDPFLEIASMTPRGFLDMECDRLNRNHQAEDSGGYRLLFECLGRMRELVGDTPLCVMLIPDQYQVDDELWAKITAQLGRDDFDRFEPQRKIATWLENESVPFLDLLPLLREVPPLADGGAHLYHLRDTHFNARGNAVTGRALSRFLGELLVKVRRP